MSHVPWNGYATATLVASLPPNRGGRRANVDLKRICVVIYNPIHHREIWRSKAYIPTIILCTNSFQFIHLTHTSPPPCHLLSVYMQSVLLNAVKYVFLRARRCQSNPAQISHTSFISLNSAPPLPTTSNIERSGILGLCDLVSLIAASSSST